MKTLNEYLDDAKAITGSDYKTSIKIGVSRQHISSARAGVGFSPMNCFKLAELLEIDERLIIAAAYVEARKGKDKSFWEKKWENIAGGFMGAALLTGTLLTPNQAEARQLNISNIIASECQTGIEIMRNLVYRLFSVFSPFSHRFCVGLA